MTQPLVGTSDIAGRLGVSSKKERSAATTVRRRIGDEILRLRGGVAAGKLDDQAQLQGFAAADRGLLRHINALLDAFSPSIADVNKIRAERLSAERQTAECIGQFVNGNLDARLEKTAGQLPLVSDSFEHLRAYLKTFISALQAMTKQNACGQIDAVIPADEFQGAFAVAARGVNEMAASYLDVQRKLSAFMESLGRGDLDAPS